MARRQILLALPILALAVFLSSGDHQVKAISDQSALSNRSNLIDARTSSSRQLTSPKLQPQRSRRPKTGPRRAHLSPSSSQQMQPRANLRGPHQLAQLEVLKLSAYNNAPPYFETVTRDLYVDLSRQAIGSKICTVKAIDVDGDQLEYFIQPSIINDASPYFAINSTSGELTLANKPLKFHSNSTDLHEQDESSSDSRDEEPDELDESQNPFESSEQAKKLASRNLYFLNVMATDGHYNSNIEFQIHVINMSEIASNPSSILVHLSPDGGRRSSEIIDRLIKMKATEFYNQLSNVSNSGPNVSDQENSSYKIVYPDYVNPSITRPGSDLPTEPPSSSSNLHEFHFDHPVSSQAPIATASSLESPNHSTLGPTLPTFGAHLPYPANIDNSNRDQQPSNHTIRAEKITNSPMAGLSQPLLVVSSIVISCLMITMIVMIFVLSVKQLKARLKHFERQHHLTMQQQQHHDSRSSNCGSSSIVCSLGSSTIANTHSHLPSLSHFTVGSDGSTFGGTNNHYSRHQDQNSVFCLPSDSRVQTDHTGSIVGHVDNGSILNPIYIRNQQQSPMQQFSNFHQSQSMHQNQLASSPRFIQQSNFNNQAQIATSQPHGLISLISNRINPRQCEPDLSSQTHRAVPCVGRTYGSLEETAVNQTKSSVENIYYPLEDEFYTTISNDPINSNQFWMSQDSNNNQVQLIASEAAISLAQAHKQLDDTIPEANQRQTDSPNSESGSSIRSLVRFLSLPNRHQSINASSDSDNVGLSHLTKANMNYNCNRAELSDEQRVMQFNQERATKTIARGCHIERESDSWEIDRRRLKLLNILDEGQFGQVWRCLLRSQSGGRCGQTVAVKMLKLSASKVDLTKEELLAEIEIMKQVCHHPNVVKILHCCTKDSFHSGEPIMLVMEHLELGNLQSFLRQSRKSLQQVASNYQTSRNSDNLEIYSQNSESQLTNDESLFGDPQALYQITSHELLKYIYHVTKGMEYIASKGIVHRDLASRNILVSADKICKIGDFGMARSVNSLDSKESNEQVYGDNQGFYERHSKNAKIPVRWMAPEVLLENRFTTKSDVFSMGILMWEIVTLGETPYKHLKTEQVVQAVARNGERPTKPIYCHLDLYDFMSKCWIEQPNRRPTFRSLVRQLDELLLSANNYIELDQYPEHNYCNILNRPS